MLILVLVAVLGVGGIALLRPLIRDLSQRPAVWRDAQATPRPLSDEIGRAHV